MNTQTTSAYYAQIWIAGDYDTARALCRKFCDVGLCVTVTPTTYIYTGGEEWGVLVRLMNYARFPKESSEIDEMALWLANELLAGLHQKSCTVETPSVSIRVIGAQFQADEKDSV